MKNEEKLAGSEFRVNTLSLEGYRGFRDLELHLHPNLTVLIGTNGAGKSSILSALRLLLTWVPAKIKSSRHKGEKLDQVSIHREKDVAQIRASLSFNRREGEKSKTYTWRIGEFRKGSEALIENFREVNDGESLATHFRISFEKRIEHIALPVIAYYGIGRSVEHIDQVTRIKHAYERLETYNGSLADDKDDFKRFFDWFREREDEELEKMQRVDRSYIDRELEAVRQAISGITKIFSRPRIHRKTNEMVLDKDGAELSVSQLSDGERTLILLVGDIARRLALATLDSEDHEKPLESYGVVLIDEIELHLHPEWQKVILGRLTSTFPNIQFVTTTHSPAVLTTISRDCIRILQTEPREGSMYPDRMITMPSIQTEGVSIDEALRAVMDIDPEPELPINQDAEHFEILVQAGELNSERVQALEEKLKKHYGEASQTFQSLISTKRLYERRERIKAMRGE